ncbi:hypothetical protein K492DRAFT_63195 [Lichtheimia hyalospora FSU 10163]|nr:hypothetical protein K492DRAFT_63195 [Lichtheimia hyalospora FSU 10163]
MPTSRYSLNLYLLACQMEQGIHEERRGAVMSTTMRREVEVLYAEIVNTLTTIACLFLIKLCLC